MTFTGDFYDDAGRLKYPGLGTDVFDGHPHIECAAIDGYRPILGADQIGGAQGVVVMGPRVTEESLTAADSLLAVGRFGVGYDTVDVNACTQANVLAMITSGAVNRSVAEALVAWMLALSHNVLAKDRLARTGQWDDRSKYMGSELRGRTLGVIGLGGIGKALVTLLAGFGMNPPIVFDPYAAQEVVHEYGAKSVPLDELMSNADFVSIQCPLTEETHNLIGQKELGLMKRSAYLLNAARGGIVNEDALYEALTSGRIAGAGIDCFAVEPVTQPSRFSDLENVIMAPHCIAWTNELFRDIGQAVCQSMLDLSLGKRPIGVLNPQLFERNSFLKKWVRLTGTLAGRDG